MALKKLSTASVIYAWAFFTVLHSLGGDEWPCNDAPSVTNSSWNSESRLDSVEGCGCSDEGAAGNCTGHETKIRLVWVRVCMHNFHKQINRNSRPDTCSKFYDDDDLCIHISWLPLSLDHTCFNISSDILKNRNILALVEFFIRNWRASKHSQQVQHSKTVKWLLSDWGA
jgi:hypothetical protein